LEFLCVVVRAVTVMIDKSAVVNEGENGVCVLELNPLYAIGGRE